MIISTNLSAIFSNEQLSRTSDKVSKSMERLSSGYKINSSRDDAVGMALSERMRLQIRGLERGNQNASDGISIVETAEGALSEINSMMNRLRELAVQGANDVYVEEDRKNIQLEVDALRDEINRIARDTEFNGVSLLDGSVQRNNYCYDSAGKITSDVELLYFSKQTPAGDYDISFNVADGKIDPVSVTTTGTDFDKIQNKNVVVEDKTIIITGANDFRMEVRVDDLTNGTHTNSIEIKDMGGMVIQMSEKEGQKIVVEIPKLSTRTLGLDDVDLTTQDGCSKFLGTIDEALTKVLSARSELGAYENRFEHSISSMEISEESANKAESRIRDTDMAEEMSTYTSLTVIQQAGISMLAQANQLPEKVLQLLQ